MGRTIILGGAIISLVDVDFKCPACGCPHTEEDYMKLYKSYYEVGLKAEELQKQNSKLKEIIELASIMIVNLPDFEAREAYQLLQTK